VSYIRYRQLDILKAHAQELIGINLEGIPISNLSRITQLLISPFTNTKSKKFNTTLRDFLSNMSSEKIYHYYNQFGVNFLIFKYNKTQELFVLGPYLEQRPNEQNCRALLNHNKISMSRLSVLKQYFMKIPICSHSKVKKMCRLAIKFIKGRNYIYDVASIDFHFHLEQENYAAKELQTQYVNMDIKARYDIENSLLIAVENGDVNEAVELLSTMYTKVVGLKRLQDEVQNAKYKSFIINVLCRKAIERAGVALATIDALSSKYAAIIDSTTSYENMYDVTQSMIIDYAQAALKIKSTLYNPKINKVVQYIELNLMNELNLGQLATYVNLAPAYLSRVFNQEVGMSLAQYITEMRMTKASELLMRTSLTVQRISEQIGFKQISYFSKKFKQHFDMTPIQYRNKYQKFVE
jgi:AraC-like DNA-binding protein